MGDGIFYLFIAFLFYLAIMSFKMRAKQKEIERKRVAAEIERDGYALEMLKKAIHEDFEELDPTKPAKFIFIDVETTGLLPQYDYVPDKEDLHLYPYIVHASCLVFSKDEVLIDKFSDFIKPPDENWEKRYTSKDLIKLSEEDINNGVQFEEFLSIIRKYASDRTFLIAHNVAFDLLMCRIEAKRIKKSFPRIKYYCTMKWTTEYCQLPNPYGRSKYKYPKLEELVARVFFRGRIGRLSSLGDWHGSLFDVKMCALCFFQIDLYSDIAHKDPDNWDS